MKKITITLLVLTFSMASFASELNILSWYRLNSQSNADSAAEVCFSLTPAPQKPTFAHITVDKGTQAAGYYSTWIGPKGSVCHVVSTARGRVEVEIPSLKLHTKKIQ